MHFEYNQQNIKNARYLRMNMTKEEGKLWHMYLKSEPIKWRRQKAIGEYIVDFYCAKAKLVVELDGGQHTSDEALKYDGKRTSYLESLGIEVIRFFNFDVNREFARVCDAIDYKVRERLQTPQSAKPTAPLDRGANR